MEIKRDLYLTNLINRMHNGMIKVITGVRRCGKTYLLFDIFQRYLLDSGVDPDHIIGLALDDEANAQYRDPAILSAYLKSQVTDDGEYYILLDEVQYAITREEFKGDDPVRLYGVLNGLLRLHNVDIYVTGSNSKLLSTDVLTEFRGRGDEVHVRPLSFSEFMQEFQGETSLGWVEYATFGGMPLVLSMKTDEQKMRYLENLFTETYLKDIVARNGVSKTQELSDLIDVLASNIGGLSSARKIEATFSSVMHSHISSNTILSYIEYLKEAFIIEEASRYDVKGRKYIGSPKKYYFEDVGLRNARLGFRQVEQTHIMENVIYNELCMRGFCVDVGFIEKHSMKNGKYMRKSLEIDFVANLGNKRYYVQSALQLSDTDKIEQETASLKEIGDNFKKIVLIRDFLKPTQNEDGILFMSLYDFLLNEDSLNW